MSTRFERRYPSGIFDRELGRELRREDPEWAEYQVALAAGEVIAPAPMAARTIAERRSEIAAQVNGMRSRALEQLTVAVNGWTFSANTASYANLLGIGTLLLAGDALPAGFTWRTVDNQLVPLTALQVKGLVRLMVQAREAVYRRSWQLKDGDIASSDSPEAIDIEAGVIGSTSSAGPLPP